MLRPSVFQCSLQTFASVARTKATPKTQTRLLHYFQVNKFAAEDALSAQRQQTTLRRAPRKLIKNMWERSSPSLASAVATAVGTHTAASAAGAAAAPTGGAIHPPARVFKKGAAGCASWELSPCGHEATTSRKRVRCSSLVMDRGARGRSCHKHSMAPKQSVGGLSVVDFETGVRVVAVGVAVAVALYSTHPTRSIPGYTVHSARWLDEVCRSFRIVGQNPTEPLDFMGSGVGESCRVDRIRLFGHGERQTFSSVCC